MKKQEIYKKVVSEFEDRRVNSPRLKYNVKLLEDYINGEEITESSWHGGSRRYPKHYETLEWLWKITHENYTTIYRPFITKKQCEYLVQLFNDLVITRELEKMSIHEKANFIRKTNKIEHDKGYLQHLLRVEKEKNQNIASV